MLSRALDLCRERRGQPVVVVTGAGVSAESGVPTFRGAEGYWRIGAREYRPQQLAARAAFEQLPREIWAWYLYRRGVCRAAEPNAAHRALVELDAALAPACTLVTQNVDGLHARAGHALPRCHRIHGDLELARCWRECTAATWALPELPPPGRGEPLAPGVAEQLACPRCGGLARPHVLWFDESYDEERYRYDTVCAAAARAGLVIVVGTSAQTSLPWQVVRLAAARGAAIIDVNVEDNPFADVARQTGGAAVAAAAGAAVPALVRALTGAPPG